MYTRGATHEKRFTEAVRVQLFYIWEPLVFFEAFLESRFPCLFLLWPARVAERKTVRKAPFQVWPQRTATLSLSLPLNTSCWLRPASVSLPSNSKAFLSWVENSAGQNGELATKANRTVWASCGIFAMLIPSFKVNVLVTYCIKTRHTFEGW